MCVCMCEYTHVRVWVGNFSRSRSWSWSQIKATKLCARVIFQFGNGNCLGRWHTHTHTTHTYTYTHTLQTYTHIHMHIVCVGVPWKTSGMCYPFLFHCTPQLMLFLIINLKLFLSNWASCKYPTPSPLCPNLRPAPFRAVTGPWHIREKVCYPK